MININTTNTFNTNIEIVHNNNIFKCEIYEFEIRLIEVVDKDGNSIGASETTIKYLKDQLTILRQQLKNLSKAL